MSVITTVEKKCRAIQVMKGKGYVDKLYCITAEYNILYYCYIMLLLYYITISFISLQKQPLEVLWTYFLTLTFLNLIY